MKLGGAMRGFEPLFRAPALRAGTRLVAARVKARLVLALYMLALVPGA